MASSIQRRRGTTSDHATFTGAVGEITIDTTKDTVVVHDGAVVGGVPLLREDLGNLPAGAVGDAKLATIATAGKVSNSATTATSALGANTIVARDGNNNFVAGTITAALTGAASSNVLKAGDTMTGALVVPLGAFGTPSLTFTGDLNTGIYSPGADQVAVATNGTQRITIDSSGRLLVGTATARANFYNSTNSARFQIEGSGTNDNYALSIVSNFAGNTNGAQIILAKSRGSNVGDNTLTVSGDTIGQINFQGADGTDFVRAAQIAAEVDGTPGANDMPGRLVFSTTADGAASPTERMRITSSGNVGIGTSAPGEALTVANGALQVTGTLISLNRPSSSVMDFQSSTGLTRFFSIGVDASTHGSYVFCTATTTTNIERVRIDQSGRVGIGTTPVVDLDVAPAASTATFRIHARSNTTPVAAIELVRGTSTTFGADGSGDYRIKNDTGNLSFEYGDSGVTSERARIDSSGRLLVGTSSARSNFYNSNISAQFQVEGTSFADRIISLVSSSSSGSSGPNFIFGKQSSGAIGGNTVVASGDNLGNISFQGSDGTEFVEGASISAFVDGTPGANDMPGRLVFSTTADGASTPTQRMRITSGGKVLINTTSSKGQPLDVVNSGSVLAIDRTTSDGVLVDFYQDGTAEGSISVSGTTVSYNGAHLSRWSQLPSGAERTEILRGTVLSNLNEMCEWGEEDNEQLNRMKVSTVEGDKNVSGVFQAWDDDDNTYINDFYCAMTGDFIIRIAEGVTVERGDLLMSAGDGTAKPQDDDIIRSKTIAKITSTNVSCTYEDGSYCVPCVLMAC